jgi:3',5'-cyclic AMP phosphodiesterase CpdA
MRRLLIVGSVTGLLLIAVAFSGSQPAPKPAPSPARDLQIDINGRNPWTHLRLNNDPTDFRFAIVSDRTGGHRAKVFSRAVDQLNMMQPEFVVSVGDLIEGYKDDPEKVAAEWREFQSYVSRLQMPFFYIPGNHDIANPYMRKQWEAKFGPLYFHFVYRDVLFLLLNANDPTGKEDRISEQQLAWIKKALDENNSSRWTVVVLHKPLWANPDVEKTGWLDVEKTLGDRPYTVFAGHVHVYKKFVRNGRNFYQLATTGGASKMRGIRYGEFDHITWVTMKKDGPVLANLLIDGIYPDDMRLPVSEELGVDGGSRKATHPVKGKVFFDGCALPEARLTFYEVDEKDPKRVTKRADALSDVDGSFMLSSYSAFDGAPAGDYVVTVTAPAPNAVPERYGKPQTSAVRVTIKPGSNDVAVELKR